MITSVQHPRFGPNCGKFAEQITIDGVADRTPTMPTAPSTFTISVFTRHSAKCLHKNNPQWRKCKCRKSLYLYENGRKEDYRQAFQDTQRADSLPVHLCRLAESPPQVYPQPHPPLPGTKHQASNARVIADSSSIDRYNARSKPRLEFARFCCNRRYSRSHGFALPGHPLSSKVIARQSIAKIMHRYERS